MDLSVDRHVLWRMSSHSVMVTLSCGLMVLSVLLVLRQVVLIVMFSTLVVGSVGQVRSSGLRSHLFLEVSFTMLSSSLVGWVIRIVFGVIVAISIWVLSLMLLVKTAVVGALGVWVSHAVVIARASLVRLGAVRVLSVAVVLLLKHIPMLITLLHFLALSASVLISGLSLDRLKRSRFVLQSTVPLERRIGLHLEDEMAILDVGLAGVEGG